MKAEKIGLLGKVSTGSGRNTEKEAIVAVKRKSEGKAKERRKSRSSMRPSLRPD
jgi:hypothetical protein